ncbi:MAG: PAS domain-containing protein [Thermoplasmatota archaeon]
MALADALSSAEARRLLGQFPVEGATIHNSFGVCVWAAGPDVDALGGAGRFLGDQGHDLFHPDDEEIALRHHEQLLDVGRGRIRQRLQAADGMYRWCVITSRVVHDGAKHWILSHVRLDEGLEDYTT